MLIAGRRFSVSILASFLYAMLALSAVPAPASGGSVRVPENARATGYGTGWECERGFRKDADGCSEVKVPPNAFANDALHGLGWECSWGYRQVEEKCLIIPVPTNAYLNSFGDKWKCDRGYRPDGEQCAKIRIPDNAHLDFSGNEWECNRPYRRQRDECILR